MVNLNDIADRLNKNEGVLSVIIFILTILLAWLAGFFKWIRNEISRGNRAKKIICAWNLFPDKKDNIFFEYKFAPLFQNKTDEIIKDFWINFASSGFELEAKQTGQTTLFEGWNMRNSALNLISKSDYRFAPQNFVQPLEITIKLRKELPEHDAWLYISYGVPGSKKVELNYRVTYKKLKKFINSSDQSGDSFLKLMRMTSNKFWRNKIFKFF